MMAGACGAGKRRRGPGAGRAGPSRPRRPRIRKVVASVTQEQPEASSTARKSAKAARTPQAQPKRCDPRWRRDLAADLLGLAGVGSLGVGLAMIHHAAALITLGALSLAAGIMLAIRHE